MLTSCENYVFHNSLGMRLQEGLRLQRDLKFS